MSFLDPKPVTDHGLDAATAAKINDAESDTATALAEAFSGKYIAYAEDFGSVGDARYATATLTASSYEITVSGGLTSADIGKTLGVMNVPTGYFYAPTITAVAGTVATVDAFPSVSGSFKSAIGTNNETTLQAGLDAISAGAGGELVFRDGRNYLTKTSLKARDGVTLRGEGSATLIVRPHGSPHHIHRTGVAPGFVHGYALDLDVMGTDPTRLYPHHDVAALIEGQSDVTGAGTIAASSIAVGDVIGIRSRGQYRQLVSGSIYDAMPYRLYFSEVIAKNGETLTLADPAPWPIADALVFEVPFGFDLDGVSSWIAKDAGVSNLCIDAITPMWGGGAYRWNFDASPPVDQAWSSFVTLNSMTHANFRCPTQANWRYTFAEIKLGSGWVTISDVHGVFKPDGATVYSPISIGESSHNIKFRNNDLALPPWFSDATKLWIDMRNCSFIDIDNNTFVANVERLDAVFSINSTLTALYTADYVRIRNNRILVRGAAVAPLGVTRVIKAFPGAGTITDYYANKGFVFENNTIEGTLSTAAGQGNQWINIARHEGISVRGNLIPNGMHHTLGGYVTGFFDGSRQTSWTGKQGLVVPAQFAVGYLDVTAGDVAGTPRVFGRLPQGAMVRSVVIEVITAFNATSGNLITVGHSSTANLYVSGYTATTAGAVADIRTGGAGAGAGLGKRLEGMSETSTRQLTVNFTGADATAGKARIYVEYLSATPTS